MAVGINVAEDMVNWLDSNENLHQVLPAVLSLSVWLACIWRQTNFVLEHLNKP